MNGSDWVVKTNVHTYELQSEEIRFECVFEMVSFILNNIKPRHPISITWANVLIRARYFPEYDITKLADLI